MEQAARLRKKKKQERFLTIAAIVVISAVVLCTVFFVVQGAMRKSVPKSDTERILGSWQEEGGRIQWTFDNSRVQVCALDEEVIVRNSRQQSMCWIQRPKRCASVLKPEPTTVYLTMPGMIIFSC